MSEEEEVANSEESDNKVSKSAKLLAATEIISAVAVIATLVFLVVEIRQNTEQTAINAKSVQMGAYQDLIAQIVELNRLPIENPEFARIWLRFENDDPLSEMERYQIGSFFWMLIRHADLAYYQYELGSISEERLESALGPFTGRLRVFPHSREWWHKRKNGFSPKFREYIDDYVAVLVEQENAEE